MELSWKLILYQMANFLVLLVLLGFLVNRFIRPFMKKRSTEIANGYAEIENGKKEVDYLKNSAHEQLLELKKRVRDEMEKAVMDGNAMRESLVTKAEREAAVLLEHAKEEIGHEREKALKGIRVHVSAMAMRAASKLIEKRMDSETNQKLIEDFLDDWKPEIDTRRRGA